MSTVKWVAVGVYTGGGSVITYSYDGINWSNASNVNMSINRLSAVAHSGSVWVLGGWPYNAQGSIPPVGVFF